MLLATGGQRALQSARLDVIFAGQGPEPAGAAASGFSTWDMPVQSMKRTPLFATHQKLGGKLIEFGGWEMPVQYTRIMDEHLTVRKAAGLFDISHMGEISVAGPEAESFLNRTLTNDARKLLVGQGQYTLMCNEHGGVIDDLYAYRLGPAEFLLIVNASRIEQDFAWLQKQAPACANERNLSVQNISD